MPLYITATNSFSRTWTSLLRSKLRKMFDWSPAVSSSSSWQGSSSLLLLLPLLEKEKNRGCGRVEQVYTGLYTIQICYLLFCKMSLNMIDIIPLFMGHLNFYSDVGYAVSNDHKFLLLVMFQNGKY